MTFQRKLLLGFSLMVLPALLVGAEAIRNNALERKALGALGESMSRTRTYAELETAMFDQSELVWRYLSGLDPTAREEFRLNGQVVDYWQDRWRGELKPGEMALADGVANIQRQMVTVAESVFSLADSGHREDGYRLAQRELRGRLQPALTAMNREIYRRARESSVRGAYGRLEEILANEGRALVAIIALALLAGLGASWLISRSLARPVRGLTAPDLIYSTIFILNSLTSKFYLCTALAIYFSYTHFSTLMHIDPCYNPFKGVFIFDILLLIGKYLLHLNDNIIAR